MAKKNVNTKKMKNKSSKKAFNIETVTQLGGTEEDFKMLQNIDTDEDDIDEVKSVKSDGSDTRTDIKEFISKLGFGNQDKKKRTSNINDADDEESDEDKPQKIKQKKKEKVKKSASNDKNTDKNQKSVTKMTPIPKLKTRETSSTSNNNKTPKLEKTKISITASGPTAPIKSTKKSKNKFKVQHDEISSSTTSPEEEIRNHIASYRPRKFLIVKPNEGLEDDKDAMDNNIDPLPLDVVQEMENFAAKLLQDEVETYRKKKDASKSSEAKWIQTVLASGTLSDKMAALTLLIQESPVHNLSCLENLVNMSRKKGKRECILATETLSELFLTEVLPSSRKLRKFNQNPLTSLAKNMSGQKDLVDKKLILWYFESQLKQKYSIFIKALDTMSHDTVLAPKQKAVTSMFKLLSNKPEQENILLPMLVNKLGDPDYKLASRAAHHLSKLVEQHSRMTMVVIQEVERLLYRPNICSKAQYYAMCFLSQIVLDLDDKELAMKLIDLYFSFFTMYVKKREVDNKMMCVLLTGVNRAYPYAKVDQSYISEQMNNLHKVVHMVNFNTGLQALMLLYQIMDAAESVSDRFYVALYRKLADPELKSSSKQTMFLNLLYKAMRSDVATKRIKAFLKRLLQVCSYQSAQFVCGALILVSEIVQDKPGLLNLHSTGDDSDEEEHFEDLPEPEEFKTTRYHSDSEAALSEGEVDLGDQQSSWIHRKNLNAKSDNLAYDPFHRNPLYCRADTACIWELKKLTKHFHPSVVVFTKNILKGVKITYSGDPLQDFTLIRFLERFVYKNPKKLEDDKESGGKSKTVSRFRLKPSLPSGVRKLRVNEAAYLAKGEKRIPADEKFFYRYFRQRADLGKRSKKEDSDVEDVSDDEFEAFLDNFEKQADPKDVFMRKDLDLDFAGEFSKKKGQKKKKKGEESSSSDEDIDGDDEDDNDLSDEEPEFDEAEMKEAFKEFNMDNTEEMDFNEEDVAFSSDDDENKPIKSKKTLMKRKAKMDDMLDSELMNSGKKKKSKNIEDLYAAAEEFSTVMDSNIDDVDVETLGSQALSNTANSDIKQVRWEVARDKWIHDKDWKSKKRQGSGKGRPQKAFGSGSKKKFKAGGRPQKPRKK
ncbi:CCAAT/enhancer-binding protein zeta [Patella vulgata]|uniref:CCAAT/enhancer-binding protein zeta n=1 Tax=Patella vulgata TaxID=6465 RepID=UPI00217FEDA4|nr:CCAAT/enhancer-binding protein zeta [Patella vulgata]